MIWKSIPSFEGQYEASVDGQIRSLERFSIRATVRACVMKGNVRPDGYSAVTLADGKGDYKSYLTHRIIYLAHVGPIMPGMAIDHINGDRKDNRVNNLRLVTPSQNQMNRASANKRGIPTGIYWCETRKRWVVQIKVNGRAVARKRVGKLEDAVLLRKSWELQYFGEFAPKEVANFTK